MPLKSLINVDVDDGKFRAFMELFAKYQEALKELPAAWGSINDASAKSGAGYADMTAAMMAQAEIIHRLNQEERQRERTTSGTASAMRKVAHEARDVSRHITDATRMLLRWGGISGALGGLAGFGGLFGLERLTSNASSLRTRSMGTGVRPGTLLALQTDFGQFIDSGSALQRIVATQQNPNLMTKFNNMGLAGDINAPPAKALLDVMGEAHRFYQQTKTAGGLNFLSAQPEWQAITSILGDEGARTFGNMSGAEFRKHAKDFTQDAWGNFGLKPDTVKAAQDFQQQLMRVSNTLEYTFLAALDPLMPELTELSGALGQTVASFLRGDGFATLVGDVSIGLHGLSSWINSDHFQGDIHSFTSGVGMIAGDLASFSEGLLKALKIFHMIPDPAKELNKLAGVDPKYAGDNIWDQKGWESAANAFDRMMGWPMTYPDVANGGGGPGRVGGTGAGPMVPLNKNVANQIKGSGLPPEAQALLGGIAGGEAKGFNELVGGGTFSDYSGFPSWKGYQGSHAAGLLQDEPSTWQKIAAGTGLKDFGPQSQLLGNWWWAKKTYHDASGHNLLADLKSGHLDPIGRSALYGQWPGGFNAGWEGRYHRALATLSGANGGAPPAAAAGTIDHSEIFPAKASGGHHQVQGPLGELGPMYSLDDKDYAGWGRSYDTGTADGWWKSYLARHVQAQDAARSQHFRETIQRAAHRSTTPHAESPAAPSGSSHAIQKTTRPGSPTKVDINIHNSTGQLGGALVRDDERAMRYYDIKLTRVSDNKVVEHWTSHPKGIYAAPDPGALRVELDLVVTTLSQASAGTDGGDYGSSHARIWGVPLQIIAQATNWSLPTGLPTYRVEIMGGMGKGYPLANPTQAGLLTRGSIYRAIGNWVGTEMAIDLFFLPASPTGTASTGNAATPATQANNIVFNAPKGTPLAAAIYSALQVAYPGMPIQIGISPGLVLSRAEAGYYPTLGAFADYLNQRSLATLGPGNPQYIGIQIAPSDNGLAVYDGTTAAGATGGGAKAPQFKTVNLAITDLIGQPTWVGNGQVQVTCVQRGDVRVGDMVTLPPTLATVSPQGAFNSPAGAYSQAKWSSQFQGTFTVQKIRHVGDYKSPQATGWVTVLNTFTASGVNAVQQ